MAAPAFASRPPAEPPAERVSRVNRALAELCRRRGGQNLFLLGVEQALEGRYLHAAPSGASSPLDSAVAEAIEAERGRIAGELHDTASQSLIGILLNLELVERRGLAAAGNGEVTAALARCKQLTLHTLEELRGITHQLNPPDWKELSLAAAVERMVETMALRDTLSVEIHEIRATDNLPPAVLTVLYRTLQEALSNVMRHSGARHVSIRVPLTANHIGLIVEDDGRGFRTSEAPYRGIGLANIRRRVEAAGGRLEIESTPGQGMRLAVFVPTAAGGG